MNTLIDNNNNDSSNNDIENLNTYKQNLIEITQQIKKLSQPPQNFSMFSRAAEFWYSVSWWQKIIIGIVLIGLFVTPGIVASITPLIIIGAVLGVFYIIFNFLLQDHHTKSARQFQYIEETLAPLSNLLTEVIAGLGNIYTCLKESISHLNRSIMNLQTTSSALEQRNQELNTLITTLKRAVSELSDLAIADKESKEEFLSRLEIFINDREKSFHEIISRISDTEERLVLTQQELAKTNAMYVSLFNEHKSLYASLFKDYKDVLESQKQAQIIHDQTSNQDLLNHPLTNFGIYNAMKSNQNDNIDSEQKESEYLHHKI